MFIFPALVGCLVLVTLGYLALWTSSHENTAKALAGFGKVLAIILFVFAGLVITVGAVFSFSPGVHEHMRSMMMTHGMQMKGCPCMEGMHHEMGLDKDKECDESAETRKGNMKEMMKK
jgi:hypothetical protein